MAKEQKQFEVNTPMGTLRAVESMDEDYPGIVLMRIDADGKEAGACIFEYSPAENQMVLRVYSHENPDGDPIRVIPMSEKKN